MPISVGFKDNKVLLCLKKLFFTSGPCPPCDGHKLGDPTPCTLVLSAQPSTVRLAASDVQNCVSCVTAPTTEDPWDGCLEFNLSDAWSSPGYPAYRKTPAAHLISANISFDGVDCLFRLIISCRNGGSDVLVWSGEKELGDSPCGIYFKTGGCDAKTLMMVG